MSEPKPHPEPQPPRRPRPPQPPRKKIALAEDDDGRGKGRCRCCGRVVESRHLRGTTAWLLCPECAKRPTPCRPSDAQLRTLPTATATETDVRCPQCGAEFGISPELYNQVGQCDSCKTVFLILPPNVLLKLQKNAGPSMVPANLLACPPSELNIAKATATEVTCPRCGMVYPITAEVYGAIAECSECGAEFMIGRPASGKGRPESNPN